MTLRIITAAGTLSGAAMYRATDGTWHRDATAAAVYTADDADALDQALDQACAEQAEVCDPYPIEVVVSESPQQGRSVLPTAIKERVRMANAPTIKVPGTDVHGVAIPGLPG